MYAQGMDKAKGKSAPKWELIAAEYISTTISCRKLHEKYDIPFRTVTDRCTKGEWARHREEYRRTVVKQTVKKAASRASAKDYQKLVRLQTASERLSEHIDKALQDEDQFRRHIVIIGNGMGASHAECNVYDKRDARAIRDMSTALKDLASTMRNVFDIQTSAEEHARKIADAKLKLDQDKAAREADADKPAEVKVVFDENEGWAE